MGIFDWLKPRAALDAATRALVEHAVDRVDPQLRLVSGYAQRLAPAVRHAYAYCDDIAQRIPGPVEVSRAAFATDPLVHALFGSADDIDLMFARSQCVREHMTEMTAGSGHCCALLGMRRHVKSRYGTELAGTLLRSDVPQKVLYFSDHTLAEPSPDVPAARQRLAKSMFEGLLENFAAHVAAVRSEHDILNQQRAFAQAAARGGKRPDSQTRRLESLDAQLRAASDALQPSRLIETLAVALADPAPYLHLDPVSLSVDRNGVIGAATEGADTLDFVELTSRDQRRWVVLLVLIDRNEVQRALECVEQANRYIVI